MCRGTGTIPITWWQTDPTCGTCSGTGKYPHAWWWSTTTDRIGDITGATFTAPTCRT